MIEFYGAFKPEHHQIGSLYVPATPFPYTPIPCTVLLTKFIVKFFGLKSTKQNSVSEALPVHKFSQLLVPCKHSDAPNNANTSFCVFPFN